MVKKTVKAKTKELFEAFLKDKGYGVYNDGFMSTHYAIRKPKPNVSHESNFSNYHVDDLLESNLDSVESKDVFHEFLKRILNQGEHEVALYQAIKKTPSPKNYEYDNIVRGMIDTLSPFKKTLFEYFARPRFLEHNLTKIDRVFKVLDSQEHRVAVIEAVMQTNTFNSLDTQRAIYNIVQAHIKVPAKFDSYFEKITKVQEHQSVVDYVDSPSVVIIGFTEEKLIGANLNTEMAAKTLVDGIGKIANILKKEYKDDLKIINVLMDYDKDSKQHTLNVICPQSHVALNKLVFEEIINDVSRLSTWNELNAYRDETKTAFIKKCKSFQMHEELYDNLNTNDNEGKKKTNKL
jgi:hypothetical protein